jgi:very-short-patch-repair endonuclease
VAYPELLIGIEGKSKEHHLNDEAFESDPMRDADLAIAGWIIIHVTWAQIDRDPAGVVRRIRQAITRRAGVAA